jgi:hypothetical protein
MGSAIELLLTLLQLGPIFVLSIGSNPLNTEGTPKSRQAQTTEPEIAEPSS